MALAGKNELAGPRGCGRDVRSDGADVAACARPVRLAPAGERILERSDARRRGGAISRHGYDALSQTVESLHEVRLRHLVEPAVHQPHLDVERVRMLNRLAADRLEAELFVHLVERLRQDRCSTT